MNSLYDFKHGLFLGLNLAWNLFFVGYNIYHIVSGTNGTLIFVIFGSIQILYLFYSFMSVDEVLNEM